MKIFTALECVADDQIEDGRKIVPPGGRAVAYAVSDLLKDAGIITTIPELDCEHGWEFDAAQNGSYTHQRPVGDQACLAGACILLPDRKQAIAAFDGVRHGKGACAQPRKPQGERPHGAVKEMADEPAERGRRAG